MADTTVSAIDATKHMCSYPRDTAHLTLSPAIWDDDLTLWAMRQHRSDVLRDTTNLVPMHLDSATNVADTLTEILDHVTLVKLRDVITVPHPNPASRQ